LNGDLDILNLEWPGSERDLHIVTPILVYLQKKEKINVVTKSIFNGYYYLLKYRPKMLLISNFAGDKLNHEIVKLAYKMNIKVISLISEGNVKEKASDQFLWGWNSDKILYADKLLLWSRRSEEIFLRNYPKLKGRLVNVGATGFDRYKLLDFKTKETFIKENGLRYKKIIGIAAWGFDHLFGAYFQKYQEFYYKTYGRDQIRMHREDLLKLQNIYKALIRNNSDILFILRYHPGVIDKEKTEFLGLEKYKNVYISKRNKIENYCVSDLINISDIWIGYETTTALEAWLLGKETFLINPSKSEFIRENVYKGSPIVKEVNEAQALIDEYYRTNSITRFQELRVERERIVSDVIGYDDGKNHIRAANEIMKVLASPDKKFRFRSIILSKIMKQTIQRVLAKTVLADRYNPLHYLCDFADEYYKRYFEVIDV